MTDRYRFTPATTTFQPAVRSNVYDNTNENNQEHNTASEFSTKLKIKNRRKTTKRKHNTLRPTGNNEYVFVCLKINVFF